MGGHSKGFAENAVQQHICSDLPSSKVDLEFWGLVAEPNSELPNSSSQECGMGDHNASQGGVWASGGVYFYGKEYTQGGGVDIL